MKDTSPGTVGGITSRRRSLEGKLAAAFKAEAETDQKARTVHNLLGILEMKVADVRASHERHGGKHIPLLLSSVRAYTDLLEEAYHKERGAQESAS